MTVKEIHDHELTNYDRLYFRREGMFWKASDHSAFLLHLLGFDYQVTWSSSKALPEGVVRVGTSVHPKVLLPGKKVIVDEDRYVVLEAGVTFVDAQYFEWRGKAIEGTTSLVKTPKRARRTIKPDQEMEAALREETSVKETSSGSSSPESHSVLPTARHWRDGIVDRLRVFDVSGSSMQAFVLLVFSLKEEIASHDREEADAGR